MMKPCLSSPFRAAIFPAAVLALAVLASACNREVYVSDDIAVDFDASLTGASDSLHQPYVLGTPVTISAFPGSDGEDTAQWWMVSSNPGVIRIQAQHAGSAKCVATGVGHATLSVYASVDDREPMRSVAVDVRQADRAARYAHGPLIVRQGEEAAREQTPRIVAGGRATFLVRYFAGDTRLYGNRVLGLAPSEGVDAEVDSTFLLENQDWVRIAPTTVGPHTISLSAAGVDVGTVTVEGVDADTVERLALVGEPEDGAQSGQTLSVLAQALDRDDRLVFGASLSWELDGTRQSGFGDLFRHTYEPDTVRSLRATNGTTTTDGVIHASGGYVSSSVPTGCNMTPHVPDDAWVLAVSGLAALLALGRRRRA